MRVTSHCVNHPSKEAGQRCRSCGTWLCDLCARRYGRHIYCGRRCQAADHLRTIGRRWAGIARRPVHGAWAISIAAGAAALLLTAIGLAIAELGELSEPSASQSRLGGIRPSIAARVDTDAGSESLRLDGAPGSRVLLMDDDRPIAILTLGADGTATADLEALGAAGQTLQVASLADRQVEVRRREPAADTAAIADPPAETTARRDPSPVERRAASRVGDAPPVLQFVGDGGPRIALTFDGNTSDERTTELLDVLQDLDLRVTLFLTGTFIERYPGIVRRAVLSGHEIGNHSFSHPHLTTYELDRRHALRPGVTRQLLHAELERTENAFRIATGRAMRPLWRAPYGEENRLLRAWALEAGYLHVRWSSLEGASLDSRDWVADEHSSLYQDSSSIMARLLRFPELRGGIVLMHLSTQRDEPPWAELPAFVAELRRRGVEPTTVTEILEASPTWRPWLRRAEVRHREAYGW